MSIQKDKKLILSRIKSHYNLKSDVALADFLGIKPTTLANWNMRNSINLELIFTKCEGLNANWILTGNGLPENKYHEQPDDKFSVVNEIAAKYVSEKVGKGDYQKDIEILVKIITIQEQTIKAQELAIEALGQGKMKRK